MSPHASTTIRSLAIPPHHVAYSLVRTRRRRTMTIYVDPAATLRVCVPYTLPERDVQRFLVEKRRWIVRKLEEAARHKEFVTQHQCREGNPFLFLGKKFPLEIHREVHGGTPAFVLKNDRFAAVIPAATPEDQQEEYVRGMFRHWYQAQAREFLAARVFHYSRAMNLAVSGISIRGQKSIWGSCHPLKRNIHLNWKMVLLPVEVIDYIVVHELCHLLVPNHSKRFWVRVSQVIPDYHRHLNWLKVHAAELRLW